MDPNETLKQLLRLANLVNNSEDFGDELDPNNIYDLATYILNLDEWLSRGGALPKKWER